MAARVKKTEGGTANRYMVPVVRSTFRILEEISAAGPLGLNEITQRTKIPKSTVFRVLATLQSLGYVVRDGSRDYCVSPSIAGLAGDRSQSDALRAAALPWMVRLRNECGETVNLGQLQHDKVVYLEVVPSEFALRLSERPGATVPVHASALGKAILAFSPPELADSLIGSQRLAMFTRNTVTDPAAMREELRRVRDRGFAFDKGEISALATCVGAPILGVDGRAIAAMSISGPSSRFTPRRDSAIVTSLLQAVREISYALRPHARINHGDVAAHAMAQQVDRLIQCQCVEQGVEIPEVVGKPIAVGGGGLGQAKASPVGRDDEAWVLACLRKSVHNELERSGRVHPAMQHDERRALGSDERGIAPELKVVIQAAHSDVLAAGGVGRGVGGRRHALNCRARLRQLNFA